MTTTLRKVIFLHGFTSGGHCEMANTLKAVSAEDFMVIAPDLPLHPEKALQLILSLCETEQPALLVGSSCGAFYAQLAVQRTGLPALLSNPHFKMSDFLATRIGTASYKCPRDDGQQTYTVTTELIEAFKRIEAAQFNAYNEADRERVWGLFGTLDTLANFRELFSRYYANSRTFVGNHTMSAENVKETLAPTIREMLSIF